MKDCTLYHGCSCHRCKRRAELAPLIAAAQTVLAGLEAEHAKTYERRTCVFCGAEMKYDPNAATWLGPFVPGFGHMCAKFPHTFCVSDCEADR